MAATGLGKIFLGNSGPVLAGKRKEARLHEICIAKVGGRTPYLVLDIVGSKSKKVNTHFCDFFGGFSVVGWPPPDPMDFLGGRDQV